MADYKKQFGKEAGCACGDMPGHKHEAKSETHGKEQGKRQESESRGNEKATRHENDMKRERKA